MSRANSASETTALDELIERIGSLDDETRAELHKAALDLTAHQKWVPQEGPQTEAYLSEADLLLYGGQAGGGKTDLGLGLAMTRHERTLFMRRRYGDLNAATARAIEINGTRKGYSGAIPPKLMTTDGRLVEFGGCVNAGDEQHWQGQPHDLIVFEEGAQLLQSQVRYLMGWNRSADTKQRCRVVIASNPPLTDEGQWLTSMFAPWIDDTFPDPAEFGDLRWCITDAEGNDEWVDGPGEYVIGKERDGTDKVVKATSRTFIPAALSDNAYLRDTDYQSKLDALPEPLRSAMRDGDFRAGRRDDAMQLIPSQWIFAAQTRWTESPPKDSPMCAMGVDVAQGGSNKTVLSNRYDWWFAPLIAVPGKETPLGSDVAALVIKHRRNLAKVAIDMGGGYGNAAYEHLTNNAVDVVGFNGSKSSDARTKDRQLGFVNLRAEAWWRFREALDPDQEQGSPIALPYDPELIADLVAPRFKITPRGIQVEEKAEIIKRLGRSPDRADAVVMAWATGPNWISHGEEWRDYTRKGRTVTVSRPHSAKRAFLRKR